jgi:hypothetical protein
MMPLTLSHSTLRKLNIPAAFLLCLAASFLALRQLGYPLIGIDDANIYFVYARNLADGYGFVYNIGGERVEGFTSLLWTLISALAFKLSAHPELILLTINIILVSIGMMAALNYLQQAYPGKDRRWHVELSWSALFLILIFTSPRYIVWNTITLMENALWSTLLLLTTIFVIQEHPSARLLNFGFIPLTILLLVTRPESIAWVAVFATVLLLRRTFSSGLGRAIQTLFPSVICIGLTLGALTFFRLQYFGYPFPNTYYAKVSPSLAYNLEQGALYLIRYFLSDPIAAIGIVAIALGCLFSIRRPALAEGTFYLPILAAAGLLLPLLTGGDHFGSFRFYQNVYPLTILCLIHVARRILPNMTKSFRYPSIPSPVGRILFASLALWGTYSLVRAQARAWSGFPPEIKVEFNVAEYERRNGVFIEGLFSSLPHLPSIGVIASGGIKYSYTGEIVDLLGLNNTAMAHNHGDRKGYKDHAAFEIATFYQLQPDIVWPIQVDERKWEYREIDLQTRWENTSGFKGLFNDRRFLELYEYGKVSRTSPAESGRALVAWFKKDFLETLMADPNFNVVAYEYTP